MKTSRNEVFLKNFDWKTGFAWYSIEDNSNEDEQTTTSNDYLLCSHTAYTMRCHMSVGESLLSTSISMLNILERALTEKIRSVSALSYICPCSFNGRTPNWYFGGADSISVAGSK